MGRLRHRTAPGCTYFVTTDAWQKRSVLAVTENAQIVVEKLLGYRNQGAYFLHEFVLMPNHLHLLITPSETTSLEKAVQLIKGGSSHEIHQRRGHRMLIWRPGFHEWTVRDSADYEARRRYIRMNPVSARLVERAGDWPYGSACGRFQLDPVPPGLKLASGAEAPS